MVKARTNANSRLFPVLGELTAPGAVGLPAARQRMRSAMSARVACTRRPELGVVELFGVEHHRHLFVFASVEAGRQGSGLVRRTAALAVVAAEVAGVQPGTADRPRRLCRRPRLSLPRAEPASGPARRRPPEEPLAQRVLRQARTGQLDEERCCRGQDKREREPPTTGELAPFALPGRCPGLVISPGG